MEQVTPDNEALALEIAMLPDAIRGYERVKSESIRKVKSQAAEKMEAMKVGGFVSL